MLIGGQSVCGKLIRELVPGTLDVYPIHDYGALEVADQRFSRLGQEKSVRDRKLIVIWQNKSDAWKITRVITDDQRH